MKFLCVAILFIVLGLTSTFIVEAQPQAGFPMSGGHVIPISYTGSITCNNVSNGSFDLDVTSDSIADLHFYFWNSCGYFTRLAWSVQVINPNVEVAIQNPYPYIWNQQVSNPFYLGGIMTQSNTTWITQSSVTLNTLGTWLCCQNPMGQFGGTGYLGFRILTSCNRYLYGWAELHSSYGTATLYGSISSYNILPRIYSRCDTVNCGDSLTLVNGVHLNNLIQDTVYEEFYSGLVNGYDSMFIDYIHVNPSSLSNVYDTICGNSLYNFPDGTSANIYSNLSHSNIFTSINGCDSIVVSNISTHPYYHLYPPEVYVNCSDNYIFPDGTIITAINSMNGMFYTSHLYTVFGCDSLITTHLLVPTPMLYDTVSVCHGSTYSFPDSFVLTSINSDTFHVCNLTNINGCNYNLRRTLQVIPIYSITQFYSVCFDSSISFPDGSVASNLQNDTTQISAFTSLLGCDSLITTIVQVHPIYQSSNSIEVCIGSNVTFPDGSVDINLQNDTTNTSTLTSLYGCDSMITTIVHVNPTYLSSDTMFVCYGTSVTFPDGSVANNLQADTMHASSLSTSFGCDSIVTTVIHIDTINNSITQSSAQLSSNQIGINYQWIDCNGFLTILGATSQIFSPSNNGIYAVILNDGYCIDTSACYTINSLDQEDIFTEHLFLVYPNPASTFIDLVNESMFEKGDFIFLKDVSGRLIKIVNIDKPSKIVSLDINNFSSGLYFLCFRNYTTKFIKN